MKHSTKRVRRLDDGSSISIDSNIGMVLIYIELGKFDANSFFNVGVVSSTILNFKDAQDLGISIELLPLSRPDEDFNVSPFYADLIGLEGDELAQFMPLAGESKI
ncbi:ATP-dependent DNA helicase 2 subunit KU70 isoform X1 [Tanacetum coccineum]